MRHNSNLIPGEEPPPGLYVHVPFCIRKCRYCDFYSTTALARIDEFTDRLVQEMELYKGRACGADTLYFGGGTPSLLTHRHIDRIIQSAVTHFDLASDAEITLETNPGTVTREHLCLFKSVGINRLHMGIQSFNAENLQFLGRIHGREQSISVLSEARNAGFTNIGIDLIYGLPGQSVKSWTLDLEEAISWHPEHLSCYMLSFEDNTPLGVSLKKGRIVPLSESDVADLYLLTVCFLDSNGYDQYEVSNFAKKMEGKSGDNRSRHNRKYWNFTPYLGFGPSAHSLVGEKRWWNHADLERYLHEVRAGRFPVSGQERLSIEQRAIEALYLELRQTHGLQLEKFIEIFGVSDLNGMREAAKRLVQDGWALFQDGMLRLTPEGMLRLDAISKQMVLFL
jgi:oxygen-independent coproporphyrinogen III oxidase